jgi:hypothetical protein
MDDNQDLSFPLQRLYGVKRGGKRNTGKAAQDAFSMAPRG